MVTPEHNNKVALVLDSNFGERLSELASGSHVWLIETPQNKAAAIKYWARHPEREVEKGITTFKSSADSSILDKCLGILPTIDLHHGEYSSDPAYSRLEVIGLSLSDSVESALREFGFRIFEATGEGFLVKR
jgi:hypothetical protein